MSSFGGQWRLLRHFLSMTNLNTEVEKIVQKLRPATPDQWENFIRKLERSLSSEAHSGDKMLDRVKAETTVPQKPTTKITAPTNKDTVLEKSKPREKLKPSKDEEIEDKMVPEEFSIVDNTKELSINSVLQGLKLKKDISLGKISEPQSWRSKKKESGVAKLSLQSRTAYVIQSLRTAESPDSLLKRINNVIYHLLEHPEAKDYAFKEGALGALLRVQEREGDELTEVNAAVREALAILGWPGPVWGRGPNILSIDGGGIRGLIVIDILRHLETLTGRKVTQLFDHIVGVSTGAIIAAVICTGVGTLETANEMYLTLSKKMFGNTSLLGGTSRLVWSHSYYDTEAWEQMLKDNLGDTTLTQCNRFYTPKISIISCVTSKSRGLSPFVFRSYGSGRGVVPALPGEVRAHVWQAVRASAAAPTYFTDYHYNHHLHQDGGILVNNPCGIGIQEARMLFGPEAMKKATIVSIGTGRAPSQCGYGAADMGWRDKFHKILDSATDTEGVHLVLNELLPPGQYYRFNPPLNETCNMDEIHPDKLNRVRQDTAAYIRRNQYKFEQAALMLTKRRTVAQRVEDFIRRKAIINGLL